MTLTIAYLPGDGIGPEVGAAALGVLELVCSLYGRKLEVHTCLIGGAAIDRAGTPLPEETLAACRAADAVLLGAVGGPQWSDPNLRPEAGLLDLRRGIGVYANLRPVRPHPAAFAASPLRPERLENVDIMVVRELTGGIYFGAKQRTDGYASDLCEYHDREIARVAALAANLARTRRGKVTSVDKANVLETSRLWRETVTDLFASDFPDLTLEHILVDAMAMHLLSRAADFDVVVTENMFGDILTDEASMLCGSMGLLPSASLGDGGPGLYEPIHGSAPDIAGRGIANPFGAILSVALMLRYSLHMEDAARQVEAAVHACLAAGRTTGDLRGGLSTTEAGAAVMTALRRGAMRARDRRRET